MLIKISSYLWTVKRLSLIFLVCIYTTATFGIGVKSFYCCNKLKSTTLSFAPSLENTCKQKTSVRNCCKTKYQFCKVNDSHQASVTVSAPENGFEQLVFTPSFYSINPIAQLTIFVANYSHAPPLHNGIPIYIFDCVYRI